MPQTRFQRQVIGAASNLERWAANPWRRLSLLTIVLLASFSIGGAVGSITGALAKLDPLSAGLSVALMELATSQSQQLRERCQQLSSWSQR